MMSDNSSVELGYIYTPDGDPISPGYPRLDVILRGAPSGQHFDPSDLRVPVTQEYGDGIELLHIRHPWHGGHQQRRLCAGKVIISDQKGKLVEAFTFGGELVIDSTPERTACTLSSPAPILAFERDMVDLLPLDVGTLLGTEAEVLLAQRRAAWLHQPAEFEKRLRALDPLTLYCACIAELETKFRHPAMNDSEENIRFLQFLHTEHRHLRDDARWCDPLPIDQLL